jgi:hypothetical protein
MTLPDERYRSVLWAERFLRELATDRKKYPRIPAAVRREAYSILRHYPSQWELDNAAVAAPDVFTRQMEDLHRFVKQGLDKDTERS